MTQPKRVDEFETAVHKSMARAARPGVARAAVQLHEREVALAVQRGAELAVLVRWCCSAMRAVCAAVYRLGRRVDHPAVDMWRANTAQAIAIDGGWVAK